LKKVTKSIKAYGLILGLSATAFAQATITIKHSKGETTVSKNPKKVIILDLSALETYHELGIPVAGTLDKVPGYLDEYNDAKYAKLGNVMKPNFEALAALKPDLIITGGRQSSSYDSLAMIAPTVIFGSDSDDFWTSFEYGVNTIATLHGKKIK
jgi:iron complex transport system substrate-binding protein